MWLDSRLKQPVRINLADLEGWSKFRSRIQREIVAELEAPGREAGHKKFKMFFAVHETEAWLLSQPELFPQKVRGRIEKHRARPEAVNLQGDDRWIRSLFQSRSRSRIRLLSILHRMLDTMLDLAKNAI